MISNIFYLVCRPLVLYRLKDLNHCFGDYYLAFRQNQTQRYAAKTNRIKKLAKNLPTKSNKENIRIFKYTST